MAGNAKAGMTHSNCRWTCGCAGKTVRSRAIPERLWADDSRRGAISSVRTFTFALWIMDDHVGIVCCCRGKELYLSALPVITVLCTDDTQHLCRHSELRCQNFNLWKHLGNTSTSTYVTTVNLWLPSKLLIESRYGIELIYHQIPNLVSKYLLPDLDVFQISFIKWNHWN